MAALARQTPDTCFRRGDPMTAHGHDAVLLDAAVDALALCGVDRFGQPRNNGVYVDGTFGRGGHSGNILQALGEDGRLFAFDKDPQAVAIARERFGSDSRFQIRHAGFETLGQWADDMSMQGGVDGLLLDLGVSSPQLDDAERGFSFSRSGPLDMRMNPQAGESSAEWLARADAETIADVLYTYGEERKSRRIARAIVAARDEAPLTTTGQLAQVIAKAAPNPTQKIHPATRSFQAIRIYINNELGALEQVLAQAMDALADGGRLVVISFHSLEDRIVKRFMRDRAQPEQPKIPVAPRVEPTLNWVERRIRADAGEVAVNPRARSAVLRVAERVRGQS